MRLKGKRIFVVDDDARNRVVFHMALVKEGAIVDYERRGKDALWRMESFADIDLVILDIMLADGVSGFAIFDDIRAHKHFGKVPIVAVTAADPVSSLPIAIEKGFSGFIAKPINVDEFADQLARIIDHEKVFISR
jgi:CheY-like chemotaxis protein